MNLDPFSQYLLKIYSGTMLVHWLQYSHGLVPVYLSNLCIHRLPNARWKLHILLFISFVIFGKSVYFLEP